MINQGNPLGGQNRGLQPPILPTLKTPRPWGRGWGWGKSEYAIAPLITSAADNLAGVVCIGKSEYAIAPLITSPCIPAPLKLCYTDTLVSHHPKQKD